MWCLCLLTLLLDVNNKGRSPQGCINHGLEPHQFGGVLLGEHLGQLFTIAWTVMLTISFASLKIVPRWINWLGYVSSSIYLLAQADLFATVMPGFPVWDLAGFIGMSLWLVWLVAVGAVLVFYPPTP